MLTRIDFERSIELYLFASESGSAFLPAYTVAGQVIWDMSWSDGMLKSDLGPRALTDRDDENGFFPDCIRVNAHDICGKDP